MKFFSRLEALDRLAARQPMTLAGGDGNHSLATAKEYYEQSPILSMQYMAGASNANMGEEEAGENFDQAQGGEEAPENLAQMMNIRGIVRDYGITGSVKLLPYTRVKL